MAYTRTKYGDHVNESSLSEFLCDKVADINDLPTSAGSNGKHTCAIGSTAEVIEDGSKYILNNKNQWVRKKESTSGGTGSVSNEEVVDIRLGADGFVYDSAGEAVRKQTDYEFSPILLDDDTVLHSGYVNNTTGVYTGSQNFLCTDYISVSSGQYYSIGKYTSSSVMKGAMYDSQKTFIKAILTDIFDIPTDISFIRVNFEKSQYDSNLCYAAMCKPDGTILKENGFSKLKKEIKESQANLKDTIEDQISKYTISPELFNKENLFPGYAQSANGTLTTSQSFRRTDYLPVNPGENYYIPIKATQPGCYFNSEKQYISAISLSAKNITTVPSNASYMIVNFTYPLDSAISIYLYDKTGNPAKEFAAYTLYKNVLDRSQELVPSTVKQNGHWFGKKGAALGDSMTEGAGATHPWTYYFANKIGCTMQNIGQAGSRISSAYTDSSDTTTPFTERYTQINNDTDFIIVIGGTNDFGLGNVADGSGVPLGSLGDTTDTTFYGSVYYLIQKIRESYPNAELFFGTPMHRSNENNTVNNTTLLQFVDAIREVCETLSVPLIDLYKMSGICAKTKQNLFSDTIHLNDKGYEREADVIAGFLNNYYYDY